ncbi:MAG: carbamoyltransferase family protein [Planctomycetaceae bacterium]
MDASKKQVVLGLNAYSHDAGCALLVGGRLQFAAEEERYDRVRHSAAFPAGAIYAALAHAGLEPRDVQAVAFPWRRDMARWRKALYVLARLPRSFAFLRERPEGLPPRVAYLRRIARLARDLGAVGIHAPVTHVDHHLAHAAQAHRFGPRDECAILTADGMGEWTSAATWAARRGRIERLSACSYPDSLGKVYAAVTQHLGFRPDADEGKTMGLAAYGRDAFVPQFRSLLRADPRRLFRVDRSGFAFPLGRTRMGGAPFDARFGPARGAGAPLEPRHEDLAFAAQAVLEEVVLDAARRLRLESGLPHLALAGGIFLNCVLNGRLQRDAGFSSLHVFPAAGDAGAAAGAAALVAGMERAPLPHAYWGDAFDATAIDRALGDRPRRIAPDPAAAAAGALAAGRTVGWFSGRMEFGPRALGARSILADPRDPRMKDRLNATVKFREPFRPFGPAVLEEEAARFFDLPAPSPFMLQAFRVRADAAGTIPAVVHVDGTARVQTVGREGGHPPFRRLLEIFARTTGVPVLLNTSLNVRGEPIARTPEEALAVFDKTALDLLVLEDRVLEKGAAGSTRPEPAERAGGRPHR